VFSFCLLLFVALVLDLQQLHLEHKSRTWCNNTHRSRVTNRHGACSRHITEETCHSTPPTQQSKQERKKKKQQKQAPVTTHRRESSGGCHGLRSPIPMGSRACGAHCTYNNQKPTRYTRHDTAERRWRGGRGEGATYPTHMLTKPWSQPLMTIPRPRVKSKGVPRSTLCKKFRHTLNISCNGRCGSHQHDVPAVELLAGGVQGSSVCHTRRPGVICKQWITQHSTQRTVHAEFISLAALARALIRAVLDTFNQTQAHQQCEATPCR